MEIYIDPVALDLGFFKVHWYGLMYLLGFISAYYIGVYRCKTNHNWQKDDVSDLLFYAALGAIIGGRIGYIMFYDMASFMQNPLQLFKVWQGGMSFHGGLLGVLLACLVYAKKTNRAFFQVADFVAPMVPLALAFGRFGNFINSELWGKPTDLPWAMIFLQTDSTMTPRHPSMLYEMILEGFVLFIIIWFFSKKPRPIAAVSGLWVLCYGFFRFIIEFVRVPDAHINYLAWDWLTMGQLLSLPMMIFGVVLLTYAYGRAR